MSFGTKLTFHRNDPYAENPASEVRESARKTLSENEISVAEAIEVSVSTSTPDIMTAIELSERGVQDVLRRLVEKGVAVSTGAGRSTRYRLAD